MKKKIILKLIVVLVTIGIIYEGYGMIKEFTIPNRNLEEVNTKDLSSNYKSIAIMVQNEDDSWEEASSRDNWPSKEDYGYMGAECTDSDGSAISSDSILKFDLMTYHATIDTKNSIYCTLYFAKGKPLLQALEENKGSTLNLSSAVDGMYRYKGTATAVTNNYICFGTTDKTECTETNPKTYMYRIIGITSVADNTLGLKKDQLKIIKATPSSESRAWHSNNSSDVEWDSSNMKSYLNGTFYNTIKNATPNGAYWDSLITSQKWYNVDQTNTPGTTEPKTSQTVASKIALMYGTDFTNASTGTNSWLFIKNGWSSNTAVTEWTMSRCGDWYGGCRAWRVYTDGTLNSIGNTNFSLAVRPVFYLQSEINLTGAGTSTDPFRIRSMNNVS